MARLDTGWHEHPKILALGLAGMGLHAWSISYCDATRSDGFVPEGAWPALPGIRRAVVVLVHAGVWVPIEGGYRVHDYTVYNRTRAQIEAGQAEDRVRKAPGKVPDSGRIPAGNGAESGGIPRAPGPGPLKTTSTADAADAVHARARGDGGFQPLGTFLPSNGRRQRRQQQQLSDLPDEVRARLQQQPISIPPDADINHAHS